MAECKLGVALGCSSLKDSGECSVYDDGGVNQRMREGFCVFKNIRASQVGINAPKKGKMLNPIKAAKAAAKAGGAVGNVA